MVAVADVHLRATRKHGIGHSEALGAEAHAASRRRPFEVRTQRRRSCVVPGADSLREAAAVTGSIPARGDGKADDDGKQDDGCEGDQPLRKSRGQDLRSLDERGERLPDETVELLRKHTVGVCELAQVHEERRPFLVPTGVAGLLSCPPLELPDVPLSCRFRRLDERLGGGGLGAIPLLRANFSTPISSMLVGRGTHPIFDVDLALLSTRP